ncbi:MAG: TIGR04165 family Cys-rich peptide [Methanobacterium sp.]|nr:TIGR04165 family Cys-rich peptide [Methanobacterium sp.]
MKIGDLSKKCPICGCVDKTVKRDLDTEHHAHAKTGAVICSECGYVFKSPKSKKEEK